MKEYWVVFVGKSVLFRKEENNSCHLLFEERLPQDIKRSTDVFRFHTSDGKTINVLQRRRPKTPAIFVPGLESRIIVFLKTSLFWLARVGSCFTGTDIHAIAVFVVLPPCPIRKYPKNVHRAAKSIGRCLMWPLSVLYTEERKCY